MLKKGLTVILLAAFCLTMLPVQGYAARTEQTPLEKTESLEQLRALEMGYKIGVIPVQTEDIGIDTEADLKKANEYFERNHL